MFKAFGEKADNLIRMAESEAKKLGHKLVGTEHILLAILSVEDCATTKILKTYGINKDLLRQDIIKLTGWGERLDFGGNIIFDPSAKKSLEFSMEEVISYKERFIGIEHIFLGITHKSETIASILLENRGQIRLRTREDIKKLLQDRMLRSENGTCSRPIDHNLENYNTKKNTLSENEILTELLKKIENIEKKIAILEERAYSQEIHAGIGFDSHRLINGRELILGGVNIPYSKGLLGHSDADVLLHAIIDAILGATGNGNIGVHFPDTDEKFLNFSSLKLLSLCRDIIKKEGFEVRSVDCIIIAEEPKLSQYCEQMKKNIREALGSNRIVIGIKPKTNEGMGLIGNSEGIAAFAMAILSRSLEGRKASHIESHES